MEQSHDQSWESSLEHLARQFDYPPAPDLAAVVVSQITDLGPRSGASGALSGRRKSPAARRRPTGGRLAWALLLLALLAATLAVPQTRAALRSLLARVGAIDIVIDETLPTVAPLPTPSDGRAAPVDHSLALFELGAPVALEEARRQAGFEIALPTALGEPDEVYGHGDFDLPAVTLVWRDEGSPLLSLTAIGADAFAMKMVAEEDVRWLKIGGRDAVWLEGPHRLQLLGYTNPNSVWIDSNVLIWAAEGTTYRLEGDLSQAEMVAIAASVLEVN